MKILIAIDQTPFWKQIVEAIISRHWLPGTQFKILTVLEPLPVNWNDLADDDWKDFSNHLTEKRHTAAEKLLTDARLHIQHKIADCIIHTA